MISVTNKIRLTDVIIIFGFGLIILGLTLSFKKKDENEISLEKVKPKPSVGVKEILQVDNMVVFDIGGAVIKPGVYRLKSGSRISDALTIVGGLSAKADRIWVEKNVNKAETIRDGQKIYIPKIGENSVNVVKGVASAALGSNVVSLNNCQKQDLESLPGIGPAMAERILEYRDKNGGFKTVEEIKLVSGVGEKMFAKIKDKISL